MKNNNNYPANVLIVDDDVKLCAVIALVLKKAGYNVYTANDGNTGLKIFQRESPDVVVLDLRMPGADGIEILKKIKKISAETPVIIITAYGEIQSAVEAVKFGAYDYLSKPFANEEIVLAVERAVKERAVQREIHTLKQQLNRSLPLFEQMGSSDKIIKLNEAVEKVAATNITVLLYGETGTGKEVVARYIHECSPRKDKPFVAVDCGSIPESLIESELFGYEKGAFTGAEQRKTGQFEHASGGTLFLDEIGNMPKSMQGKLLRVLEERRIWKLGGSEETEIDVRIIAAGNARLEYLVESGQFRMDLYQRLNEFHIDVPPLRQRKEDVLFLSKRFLDIANRELGKDIPGLTKESLDMLIAYDWPGNVRELKNVIRRAVILSAGMIEPSSLPVSISAAKHGEISGISAMATQKPDVPLSAKQTISLDVDMDNDRDFSLRSCIENIERILIETALSITHGNKSRAAKMLKIDYSTMHYKIKEYGIKMLTKTKIIHEKKP